jgi:ATP synthase protein I
MNQDFNIAPESPSPMESALQIIRWQGYVGMLVALFFGLAQGWIAALSAAAGAGIAMFANYRFAKKMCAHRHGRDAKQIAQGMYAGEAVKLIVTAALFGVLFKLHSEQKILLDAQAVFVGYITTLLAYWYALWRRV